jgi:hypothetical protein
MLYHHPLKVSGILPFRFPLIDAERRMYVRCLLLKRPLVRSGQECATIIIVVCLHFSKLVLALIMATLPLRGIGCHHAALCAGRASAASIRRGTAAVQAPRPTTATPPAANTMPAMVPPQASRADHETTIYLVMTQFAHKRPGTLPSACSIESLRWLFVSPRRSTPLYFIDPSAASTSPSRRSLRINPPAASVVFWPVAGGLIT